MFFLFVFFFGLLQKDIRLEAFDIDNTQQQRILIGTSFDNFVNYSKILLNFNVNKMVVKARNKQLLKGIYFSQSLYYQILVINLYIIMNTAIFFR